MILWSDQAIDLKIKDYSSKYITGWTIVFCLLISLLALVVVGPKPFEAFIFKLDALGISGMTQNLANVEPDSSGDVDNDWL